MIRFAFLLTQNRLPLHKSRTAQSDSPETCDAARIIGRRGQWEPSGRVGLAADGTLLLATKAKLIPSSSYYQREVV